MIAWMAAALAQDLAVRADTLYPVSGPPIADGVVLIAAGKITAVGPASAVAIPAGVRVVTGKVATPGLIDGLCVAGLSGAQNQWFDQDHDEQGDAVRPELRAFDGFNGYDDLVGWLAAHGVTTVHTAPSPGNPIGGRSLIAHTSPGAVADTALVADGWLVLTLGEDAKQHASTTRMGTAAVIRQAFAEAREYKERRKLPLADRATVDLGMDVLVEALERRRKVLLHANRADDVLAAISLGRELGLDYALAGGAEAYLVDEAVAKAGVPLLLGPVMLRAWGEGERRNASFEGPALLADAGVAIGFATGFEDYVPKVRVVLWEAAIAATNRLGSERALRALTLGNAQILGLADRIGTLEVGKLGDVAVFDGDPFEYTTHVCATVIGGAVVSETCR